MVIVKKNLNQVLNAASLSTASNALIAIFAQNAIDTGILVPRLPGAANDTVLMLPSIT
jgi:hypothetical protein